MTVDTRIGMLKKVSIGVQRPANDKFQSAGIQPNTCTVGATEGLDTLPVRYLEVGTAIWASHADYQCTSLTAAPAEPEAIVRQESQSFCGCPKT
jgi:hypothetical protein